MRVLAISIAPLFPGAFHGGSQRILAAAAEALSGAGHQVRIACSRRPENEHGFSFADVFVEPLLELTGFFPDPYEVPPHRLAETARRLRDAIDWADRVYLHADIFHFRSLLRTGTPVVRSFHDFHYETALISAFAYGADLTIVPSDYLRRCFLATVGRSGLRAVESVRVISNGIDLNRYAPVRETPPPGIAPRRDDDLILLHPHRPDDRKGIEQAIRVVATLRGRGTTQRIRLLVPRHLDAALSPEAAAHYDKASKQAAELGVADSLEFVPWQPDESMPALYSFADVTLCLGNFIESFGLTAYESLACGTPAVIANVGAFRDAPDHPDFYRIEYGDAEVAAYAVSEAARGMRNLRSAREMIAARFNLEQMKSAYVEAIQSAAPAATADRKIMPAISSLAAKRYELAPWCHVAAGGRIYNDYAYRHLHMPGLAAAFEKSNTARSLGELSDEGVAQAELDEARETGTLIPVDSAAA
ncbi:MAG: glycosyltransferase family 4 protein [Chloroflexi bacterium]|nr:glycosyltransferase family 4 protein [Chloroflexota bacterium]